MTVPTLNPPVDRALGSLETVHLFEDGPMPGGVAVSAGGRVFVAFPRRGEEAPATVGEVRDGAVVPYPDLAVNTPRSDDDAHAFVSVTALAVAGEERLWVLDGGRAEGRPARHGGPKLICVNLATDSVTRTLTFPADVAPPGALFRNLIVDAGRDRAYLTDATGGLVVVDLATGDSWRRLDGHPSTRATAPPELYLVEGRPFRPAAPESGAWGLTLSADGSRLFFCALASRRWSSIDVEFLGRDGRDEVVDEGDKGGLGASLATDSSDRTYLAGPERNAILTRDARGHFGTLVHDDRLLWPDGLAVGGGYLYVTVSQWHRQDRYTGEGDQRSYPYSLFRVPLVTQG